MAKLGKREKLLAGGIICLVVILLVHLLIFAPIIKNYNEKRTSYEADKQRFDNVMRVQTNPDFIKKMEDINKEYDQAFNQSITNLKIGYEGVNSTILGIIEQIKKLQEREKETSKIQINITKYWQLPEGLNSKLTSAEVKDSLRRAKDTFPLIDKTENPFDKQRLINEFLAALNNLGFNFNLVSRLREPVPFFIKITFADYLDKNKGDLAIDLKQIYELLKVEEPDQSTLYNYIKQFTFLNDFIDKAIEANVSSIDGADFYKWELVWAKTPTPDPSQATPTPRSAYSSEEAMMMMGEGPGERGAGRMGEEDMLYGFGRFAATPTPMEKPPLGNITPIRIRARGTNRSIMSLLYMITNRPGTYHLDEVKITRDTKEESYVFLDCLLIPFSFVNWDIDL